jgi:6-phosphogluconolactonase (cycloisomerase 2 family)
MTKYIGGAVAALVLVAGTALTGMAVPEAAGAVYVATNGAAGNHILVYDRVPSGQLTFVDAVDTGGSGTGAGLGNQGGLRMTDDGKFLLVVNAGSHDVSVLRVTLQGLAVTDRIGSGGLRPVSIAISGRLVYVLNAGGSIGDVDNVSGFRLSRDGHLQPINGSTRSLSDTSTAPAQVEFSPDGSLLVVTEKGPDTIGVYPVSDTGLLGAGAFYASSGTTPFGFSFGKRGQMFVSEAWGAAPNASTVSSYDFSDSGQLLSLDPIVPNTETAACWLVVTNSGRYLYVTNTGSSTISGYGIRPDGTLALLDADGATAPTGAGSSPIDLAFSIDDQYLYALSGGVNTITIFRSLPHGKLQPMGMVGGLPAGTNGLVAR